MSPLGEVSHVTESTCHSPQCCSRVCVCVCVLGMADWCQSVRRAHPSSRLGVPLQRLQERFHGNCCFTVLKWRFIKVLFEWRWDGCRELWWISHRSYYHLFCLKGNFKSQDKLWLVCNWFQIKLKSEGTCCRMRRLNETLCATQFFQKRGVSEAMSACELFNAVSGLNIPYGTEDEAAFITEVKHAENWRELAVFTGSGWFGVNNVVLSDRSWRWRRGTRITCRSGERRPSPWPPKRPALL